VSTCVATDSTALLINSHSDTLPFERSRSLLHRLHIVLGSDARAVIAKPPASVCDRDRTIPCTRRVILRNDRRCSVTMTPPRGRPIGRRQHHILTNWHTPPQPTPAEARSHNVPFTPHSAALLPASVKDGASNVAIERGRRYRHPSVINKPASLPNRRRRRRHDFFLECERPRMPHV
jgi:hypothetical protein